MTILRTEFSIHGGLHLDEHKAPACDQAIRDCTLPEQIILPMNMHAGIDAIPSVLEGDKVHKGQVVATAAGQISANIHSPVNGTVLAIGPRPMASRSGLDELAIVIDVDATQPISEHNHDWQNALAQSPEVLHEQIRDAGIVGLGGAGFPTATKIDASHDVKTLLINGAECEPYICCDDRTMREFAHEMIAGAFILARAAHCNLIELGTEDNKPEAISAMEAAVDDLPEHLQSRIKVIVCPTKYPMGGERQLLEAITGKQVPSESYPADLGYIVQNVGTALAVYNAVVQGEPLISRMVTVTGEGVSEPGIYRVLLGTPISHLLNQAGWQGPGKGKVIHGGPMMGYPLADAERPISKITNCIIAATPEEVPPLPDEQPCIRCGKCTEVCPVLLLPQQLYWFARSEEFDKAEQFKIHDCIECGLCSYVCPSYIPLVDYYRYAKSEIKAQTKARIKSDRSKVKFDARNDRLEQERLEKQRIKEEKAKARAAAKKAGGDDGKNDAVAAALARVKAKKAAQAKAENNGEGAS